MASNITTESLRTLCECPVCMETFTDPRLLKCGHQFCERCLTQITDRSPHDDIKCPTCRQSTTPEAGVTSLPRSTLHQYMQELVLQLPKPGQLGKLCTKCTEKKPTHHCPECKEELSFMCDDCYKLHQKLPHLAKHETVAFDEMLVCPEHTNKMVECFCTQCMEVACEDCMYNKHRNHKVQDLNEAAEQSKKKLAEYIKRQETIKVVPEIIYKIKFAKQDLEKKREHFKQKGDKIEKAVLTLQTAVTNILDKQNKDIDASISKLSEYETKLSKVIGEQQKMRQLAESLRQGNVSAPQVIMGSRDLPNPDSDVTEVRYSIPELLDTWDKMAAEIDKMASELSVPVQQISHKVWRGESLAEWNLQKTSVNIQVGNVTDGLAFDAITEQVITRTHDRKGPIKVYATDGKLLKTLGANNQQLIDSFSIYRQINTDNKRDLYLLPCKDGSLIRMEKDGRIKDTTPLGDNLWAAIHLPREDLYVVSRWSQPHKVLLVAPDTMTAVGHLGKGFSIPKFMCVGTREGATVVVVSERVAGTVSVYTPDGQLVKKYGPKTGRTLGKLSGLQGVSMDSSGRVLECDGNNQRLLRVRTDKDGDHWECLLDKEQLGGEPVCVDVDNRNRLMILRVKGTKHITLYTF